MHNKQLILALSLILAYLLVGCSVVTKSVSTTNEDKHHITEVDSHGNVIIGSINKDQSPHLKVGQTLRVRFGNGKEITCPLVIDYSDVPKGQYLARFDRDDGKIKFAVNEGSIAEKLDLTKDTEVNIEIDK